MYTVYNESPSHIHNQNTQIYKYTAHILYYPVPLMPLTGRGDLFSSPSVRPSTARPPSLTVFHHDPRLVLVPGGHT